MSGHVLGIDIGNAGGLALVTVDGALVAVEPMPVLADGPKGRPTVNGPLLAAIVKRWAPAAAFIELVGPRPGEAAGGAFSFGRARGLVEGVLAAEGVPARMVTAPVWTRGPRRGEGPREGRGLPTLAGARGQVRGEGVGWARRGGSDRGGRDGAGGGTMTDRHEDAPHPLRSTLAYLERESTRRAKGVHPGMMRLQDDELAALLEVLRREVGAAEQAAER